MQTQIIRGFPLSPQQKHTWLLQQGDHLLPYRSQCAALIDGQLNPASLQAALEKAVATYEILRTRFERLPGMSIPLQVISKGGISWGCAIDLTDLSPQQQAEHLDRLFEEMKGLPLDTEGGRPLRASLVVLSARQAVLLLSLPALCADGAALVNLLMDVARSYVAGHAGELPPDEVMQSRVISEWIGELLDSEDAEAGRRYWKSKRVSDLDAAALPFCDAGRAAAEAADFMPQLVSRALDARMTERLARASESCATSISTLLLACWQSLLSRLSGQAEITVGVSFDGRTDEELQSAVVPLSKYLPVSCDFGQASRLKDIVGAIDESLSENNEWQECFVWEHAPAAEGAKAVLSFFPFCFEFNAALPRCEGPGISFSVLKHYSCTDRFQAKLVCVERDGALTIEFHYDPAYFGEQEIGRLASQYHTLLASLTSDPESEIEKLSIVPEEELAELLVDFNDTAFDFGAARCLHKMVEQQAVRTPDRVAVCFEGQQSTFAELDARANQLAHHLRRRGVRNESLVAVCMERSLEMIVSLLGALKAGAAYVPLDPSYPRERIGFIIEDTGASVILTQRRLTEALAAGCAQVICVDTDWNAIAAESKARVDSAVTPDHIAYVIYTSGSTGKPKGVMITHRAIANRLLWMQEQFPLRESDSVLQKTVFAFDASVWEIFVPLLAGARLVVARPDGHQDAVYLIDAVVEHSITTLQLVPSMLSILLADYRVERCVSLRRVFCGGEALSAELRDRFFERLPASLHNLYGPTESSIDATSWACERGDDSKSVPIGRPIANTQVYLLDANLNPAPKGATAELHIGGVGLARGYFGRADLTAEKFIPDMFGRRPGARLYKTGDLARHRPDGAIEYLGRIDHQLKLRGFRIEVGEIEAALNSHRAIRDSVVVVREDVPGDKRLVAYVVPAQAGARPVDDANLYSLPGGLEIAHLNKNETDLLYEEIFGTENYLRHGIELNDGDCVFDVGANIGLFTLFVHDRCQNATVYAFEPIPPTFNALETNIKLHNLNVKAYRCGLSNQAGEAEFTFYPKVSASSGRYADAMQEELVTRTFMSNQDARLNDYADELMADRFQSQTFTCELKTLSDVIAENAVERIDLLKLDAEKSELDVLNGIREADWKKIKQVVIEVLDHKNDLEQICGLLDRHGFDYVVEQEEAFKDTGLYHVYAVQRAAAGRPRGEAARLPGESPSYLTRRSLSVAALQGYLKEKLPEYMIPSAFVTLETMPLLPNGKLNRQALPAPDLLRPESRQPYVEPRNPVEARIAEIWSQITGVEKIGIHDNFFELGGHSLLATQVISSLRDTFQTEIPLRTLFEAPTVAALSLSVLQSMAEESEPGEMEQIFAEIHELSSAADAP